MSKAQRLDEREIGTKTRDLYPTRGTQEYLTERIDPVVYGDGEPKGEHSLTQEQLDIYEQNGFIVVPDVFSRAEVDTFIGEYRKLAASDKLQDREELVMEPASNRPRSIFSLHRFSELFARLSRDRRILDKIVQILDSDVYIHHTRINIKRPLNGKSFPWHSDFETWHAEDGIPRCRILSAWIMLTENNQFNGPLFLIPGSHKYFVSCSGFTPENNHKYSLRKQEYGVPSMKTLEKLTAEGGMAAALGSPGTLILHEGNVMHGSADNISPVPRTNLFFVYNSVRNVPAEKPFAAPKFRPEFLASRDYSPLQPIEGEYDHSGD
ncbi:MAG: ectoine hydroxylase [Methylohalobius crimeensis]